MITGRVEGAEQVLVRLGAVPKAVRDELNVSVGVLALKLAVRAKQKLSDDVLRVRTGRLRRSITTSVTDDTDGIIGRVGTNVSYARFQEYGFTGTQTVKQSLRKVTQAWGKPLKEPREVVVREHQRQVNYPAHSFLRSALAEMSDEVRKELAAALGRAIK